MTDSIGSGSPFESLEVTDETLLHAHMSTDQSISAGAWAEVTIDTVTKDELGEFDTATHGYTPAETGWYHVSTGVGFTVGADGDDIRTRFISGSDEHLFAEGNSGDATNSLITCAGLAKLDASNTYAVEALNGDSSDTLTSYNGRTRLTIRRAFR